MITGCLRAESILEGLREDTIYLKIASRRGEACPASTGNAYFEMGLFSLRRLGVFSTKEVNRRQ
jgi:hypothetical protein